MKALFSYIVIFVAAYAASSFIEADINFINWGFDSRFFTVIIGVLGSFIYFIFKVGKDGY